MAETIQYGLTLTNQNAVVEKAKTKKDGVYMFRGVAYKVKDGRVQFFAARGEIIEACYGFNAIIGNYDGYTSDGAKILKKMK